MLSTKCASKDLKNSKKCLIKFIISSYIFICKRKISTSKGLEILGMLKRYNNLGSMFIIHLINVIKAFENN
jgi:hypothetical protein